MSYNFGLNVLYHPLRQFCILHDVVLDFENNGDVRIWRSDLFWKLYQFEV